MRVWSGGVRRAAGAAFALALSACAATSERQAAPSLRAYSAEEAAAVWGAEDDFTRELTSTDLSIRLQDPEGGSVEALAALYRRSTLAWTEAEAARLIVMVARVRGRVDALAQWLPPEVGLAKASERIEGGFPHTRGSAISFGPTLPETDEELDGLFFHELWHVLSRRNAARHDEMYALIGFVPCTEVMLPEAARALRITNPDAPVDRHVAPVAGSPGRYVMPRLLANSAAYDAARPGFGVYFQLQFFAMTRDAAGRCSASGEVIAPRQAVAALHAAAGANTDYVFHPEEMLADNFSQLMMGRPDAPNPEVHERLAVWLGVTRAQVGAR